MTDRDGFETWAEWKGLDLKDSVVEGCYADTESQTAWDSWQASHASKLQEIEALRGQVYLLTMRASDAEAKVALNIRTINVQTAGNIALLKRIAKLEAAEIGRAMP
jgi:hypothetical protein